MLADVEDFMSEIASQQGEGDVPDFPFHVTRTGFTGDKDFFRYLQQTGVATITQIYAYLAKRNSEKLGPFIGILSKFLARPAHSSLGS